MAVAALSPRTVVLSSAPAFPFQAQIFQVLPKCTLLHSFGLEASAGSAEPQIAKDLLRKGKERVNLK